MSGLAPELASLKTVAMAVLESDGTLVEANAGFDRLIDRADKSPPRMKVGRKFLQPDFATLSAATPDGDGLVHAGLLTIGDRDGKTRSLRARIHRVGECLHVLAEHDIEELERVNDAVLAINRDYSQAQIELAQLNLRLKQRERQITEISMTDPLTGTGNRRRLDAALAVEVSRARRTGGKLSALMADIDHFKRINDQFGHQYGDQVLAAFGAVLRGQIRPTDIATRFGGDEFAVLMPHTGLALAHQTGERIRALLWAAPLNPVLGVVTASFGIAELRDGEDGAALLARADRTLYAAKELGRDRVMDADNSVPTPFR